MEWEQAITAKEPCVKTRFRLHYFMAKLEAAARDPEAFALLFCAEGFVTEDTGGNIFIFMNGNLFTPLTRNDFEGISRRTEIEQARELGVPVYERNLSVYDILNAEEGFFTTSSYCMLPLSRVGRHQVANVPGPITLKLLQGWNARAGVDIVGQALKYHYRASQIWRAVATAGAES